jgi:hypothetical protein
MQASYSVPYSKELILQNTFHLLHTLAYRLLRDQSPSQILRIFGWTKPQTLALALFLSFGLAWTQNTNNPITSSSSITATSSSSVSLNAPVTPKDSSKKGILKSRLDSQLTERKRMDSLLNIPKHQWSLQITPGIWVGQWSLISILEKDQDTLVSRWRETTTFTGDTTDRRVRLQRTPMIFPLSLRAEAIHKWGIGISGSMGMWYYSDQAIAVRGDQNQSAEFTAWALPLTGGLVWKIPNRLLRIDSTQDLRLQWNQHYWAAGAWSWNNNRTEFNSLSNQGFKSSGWSAFVSYRVGGRGPFAWGLHLGYLQTQAQGQDSWTRVLSHQDQKGSWNWDLGGPIVLFDLSIGNLRKPKLPKDSTALSPQDSLKTAPIDTLQPTKALEIAPPDTARVAPESIKKSNN